MINFKKGPALSLGQSDKVAKPAAGEAIEAGHVVRIASNGEASLGVSETPAADLLGFAITDVTDGDAIESGKIGVYLLDGATVVETDKAVGAINSTNYPIGAAVTANDAGLVAVASEDDRVIGQVEGIRNLPSVETVNGRKIQATRAMLGVKLSA
jgi:hypothetical protein